MMTPFVKWWNSLRRGSMMPSAQYTDLCRYLGHARKTFNVQICLDSFLKINKLFSSVRQMHQFCDCETAKLFQIMGDQHYINYICTYSSQ